MVAAGPQEQQSNRPHLDGPPPGGSRGRRASLLDVESAAGPDASNPQILALQGLKMMEQGAQALMQGIPALQAPLGQIIAFVRQAVPQALTGGNPVQVPALAPTAGGAAPMTPPPPPMGAPGGGMQ